MRTPLALAKGYGALRHRRSTINVQEHPTPSPS